MSSPTPGAKRIDTDVEKLYPYFNYGRLHALGIERL